MRDPSTAACMVLALNPGGVRALWCVVGVAWRKRKSHGRSSIRGNHMNLGGPSAAAFADRLRSVFFKCSGTVRMNLDGGRIQAERLNPNEHDLFALQLFKGPIQHTILRSASPLFL
jgi:hypothetical protein